MSKIVFGIMLLLHVILQEGIGRSQYKSLMLSPRTEVNQYRNMVLNRFFSTLCG